MLIADVERRENTLPSNFATKDSDIFNVAIPQEPTELVSLR